MMAEPSPLPARQPDVLVPPDYAPGVKVETWQETATHEVGMDVSLSLGRHVRIAEEELLRALATAVRNAPTTDRAALIILDELEVTDQ